MALREEVQLEIAAALRQLDLLQQRLADLSAVIQVPVDIQGEEALASLEQQIQDASAVVDVDVDTGGLASAEQSIERLNTDLDQTGDELSDATRQADRFGRELDTTGQRGIQAFGGIRNALGPLLAGAVAGLGLGALVQQFQAAIDSATALEESINAVNVTFGQGAADVLAFGENAAQSVGLAASQFNELVVPLGALLANFNLDGREAAAAAEELAVRAADLASVFNVDVTDALTAVGAALRGEQEPIRRFGVNLNQAAIDAKALELGLVEAGEQATIAARGQAAYQLILEQTAFAAGDFANTSEGAANQQRILAAEAEEARAALGDALLPAFEQLLAIVPDLIQAVEDMAPAIGALVGVFGDVVTSAGPFFTILGDLVAELGAAGEAAGDLEGVSLFDVAIPFTLPGVLGLISEQLLEIDRLSSRGFTNRDLEDFLVRLGEAAEDTSDPVALLGEVVEGFADEGRDAIPFLEDFAEAIGLSDSQLASFVQGLILSRDRLDLTAEQIGILRNLLSDLGQVDVSASGALVGFENLSGGSADLNRNLAATTEAVDGADRALLNFATGSDQAAQLLVGTSEAFPVIIRDLDDLALAAADADVSVLEFVNNLPENVTLNLSGAETEVLSLIETLDGLETRLSEINQEQFANIELPELEFDAEGAVTNLDEVVTAIIEQAGADAVVEANLAEIIIGADAIDLAGFIETLEPEVEAALAAAFAQDQTLATEAQTALDGTMEGLAPGASEALAAALAIATPREVAELGVFAADNFVSQSIRDQIGESAAEVATQLTNALDGTVIQPEMIIDMTNVVFENLPQLNFEVGSSSVTGTTDTGGTTPGTPGGGVQLEVNINNATTQDVTTSATQAAQTIQAVSSTLNRVE